MKKRKKKVYRNKNYRNAVKLYEALVSGTDGRNRNLHNTGYIYIGGVLEHHLILEAKIGRKLTQEEVCHHKDYCKTNNYPSNLILCANQAEHLSKYHSLHSDQQLVQKIQEYAKNFEFSREYCANELNISVSLIKKICHLNNIVWNGSDEHELNATEVHEFAKTHNTEEVAKQFGVHVSTIHRRFPELKKKTAARNFLDPYKDEILSLRKSGLSYIKIAEKFGSNKNSVRAAVLRWESPKSEYQKKVKPERFLDQHREEIYRLLLLGVTQISVAKRFSTNRTTLAAAIRRWIAADEVPLELVNRLNLNKNRTQKF